MYYFMSDFNFLPRSSSPSNAFQVGRGDYNETGWQCIVLSKNRDRSQEFQQWPTSEQTVKYIFCHHRKCFVGEAFKIFQMKRWGAVGRISQRIRRESAPLRIDGDRLRRKQEDHPWRSRGGSVWGKRRKGGFLWRQRWAANWKWSLNLVWMRAGNFVPLPQAHHITSNA